MLNVEIRLNLVCIYFLRKLKSVEENFIEILLIHSKFYTGYPGCDVIKIDLIIKQDGGWLMLFVLQYFRN